MVKAHQFDVFDMFHGVHKAFLLPENEVQQRDKPRASSLTSDAREIAYQMAGVKPSNPHAFNPERMDGAMTAEQGRMFEDLLFKALEHMDEPIRVVDRQRELPENYFVSGHPDGRVELTRTGVESKHFGRFAYKELARDGIWGGKGRDILIQSALYADALDWEDVLIIVTSQDASSMRMELNSKQFKDKGIHPKGMIFRIDREELRPLIPQLKERAEWFTNWKRSSGDPAAVKWESNPSSKKFPYSYSEYVDLAIADGPGWLEAPPAIRWD